MVTLEAAWVNAYVSIRLVIDEVSNEKMVVIGDFNQDLAVNLNKFDVATIKYKMQQWLDSW